MCLDPKGSFSHAQPRYFERISMDGVKPALIFADGGSPIAVLPDGNLYYVGNDENLTSGGLQVTRNSPDGGTSVFAPEPEGNNRESWHHRVSRWSRKGFFMLRAQAPSSKSR